MIRDLARTYLVHQRQGLPRLVEASLLPDPSDQNVIEALVQAVEQRHRSGVVDEIDDVVRAACSKLSAVYVRFSCDNSSPTSNADQLVNALLRATQDGHFGPWV